MKCLLFGVPDDIGFDQLLEFTTRRESLPCGEPEKEAEQTYSLSLGQVCS